MLLMTKLKNLNEDLVVTIVRVRIKVIIDIRVWINVRYLNAFAKAWAKLRIAD